MNHKGFKLQLHFQTHWNWPKFRYKSSLYNFSFKFSIILYSQVASGKL